MSTQRVKISEKAEGVIQRVKSNQLIGRREVKLRVFHVGMGTPSREEIRRSLSEAFSAKPNLVVVKKITGSYGTSVSNAVVFVYESEDQMRKVEPEYLLKRGKKEEKNA
jgi:small subunit ribosomal protein S24e